MADVDSKSVLSQGAKKVGPTVGQVGQEQTKMAASEHLRYRAGVVELQFMMNDVPEIAYAVKKLSRQGQSRQNRTCRT